MTDSSIAYIKKKKNISSKYNYSFGDVHPGVNYGHKKCLFVKNTLPVPAKMGWLWKDPGDPTIKCRHGWQPGAIGKSVKLMVSQLCHGTDKDKGHKKKKKHGAYHGAGDSEIDEPLEPKPALKVIKKGNVFTIQVNPLKDLKEIASNEDPYVDCDPIFFKIVKKLSPEEMAIAEARKLVKLKQLRDAEIRKALTEATEEICKCAYMDVFCNDLTAIDKVINSCPTFKEPDCICEDKSMTSLSSNATWDIEYTPPFGCFDLASRRRKHFIHVGTQYNQVDAGIVQKPKKPQRPSPKKGNKCCGIVSAMPQTVRSTLKPCKVSNSLFKPIDVKTCCRDTCLRSPVISDKSCRCRLWR